MNEVVSCLAGQVILSKAKLTLDELDGARANVKDVERGTAGTLVRVTESNSSQRHRVTWQDAGRRHSHLQQNIEHARAIRCLG